MTDDDFSFFMATRKVFGRQIPFPKGQEPRCKACFNLGAKDHAPGERCVSAEWSHREFARKDQGPRTTTITTSPFGPCKTCDSTACVCTCCGTSESKHQKKGHDFDPTDCPICTQREVTEVRR